ncbi:MAG TPA: lysylphosphatidylglycerol synthase transmembrane domain-containing protein [Thermomicrobiales bacterium]|nr:lysylphosphatidylglycerol synthase transmembrane domain-containing protein [Thermomicrobiales bacterium]
MRLSPVPISRPVDILGTRNASVSDVAPSNTRPGATPGTEAGAPVEEPSRPPDSLGRRVLQPRTLLSFVIAAFIVYFVFRRLDDPAEVWRQLREADVTLVLAALGVFYFTFVIRAFRWLQMLRQAGVNEANGYQLPGVPGTMAILLLSWFANCVVPARLGDAYRSFLLKDRTGASFGLVLGTILAERLIDLVVLVLLVLSAGAVVFGTHAPGRAEQAFVFGMVVVVLGVVGAVLLYRFRDHLEERLPDQFSGHFVRLNRGIFDILRRPTPFAFESLAIWMCDGLRLYLVAWSLGVRLSLPEALVVSLLSALVTVIPITPAGVGVVEGFMIWMLPQVGVPPDTAAAIAILDRVITYWSLIVIGLPLYLWNLRRDIQTAPATDLSKSGPVGTSGVS